MAAARFMPGVCAVLMSSSPACTTRTPSYFQRGSVGLGIGTLAATICRLYCRTMMTLLLSWLVNTVSLIAVAYLMPSSRVSDFVTALIAALVLGLVNTIIRPILVLLTLPVTLLTLGLFILVINGLLFWFVGSFVQGFVVQGFWAGFVGAILFSIVSWLLAALVLKGDK